MRHWERRLSPQCVTRLRASRAAEAPTSSSQVRPSPRRSGIAALTRAAAILTLPAIPAGATPVGGVHASPGCTPTNFGSPAPFSLAGAGIEAGARYGGPARTPGVGLGSGLPPHYVPPASAGRRGTMDGSAACTDIDAPPLRSLFDLPAAAPADARPAPRAATAGPRAGAGAAPAGDPPENEHWVTVFGYTSPAMVPQVLELLRPSAGAVVHQVRGGRRRGKHQRVCVRVPEGVGKRCSCYSWRAPWCTRG